MLAQRALRVIAVDNSEKMVEYGAGVARDHGVKNIEVPVGRSWKICRLKAAEVDLALLHQSLHHSLHPAKTLEEAWRILKPGGPLRRDGPAKARSGRGARVVRRRVARVFSSRNHGPFFARRAFNRSRWPWSTGKQKRRTSRRCWPWRKNPGKWGGSPEPRGPSRGPPATDQAGRPFPGSRGATLRDVAGHGEKPR